MLKKEDKDGIIEFLKSTLQDVDKLLVGITLYPDDYDCDVDLISRIRDRISHALIDVTW